MAGNGTIYIIAAHLNSSRLLYICLSLSVFVGLPPPGGPPHLGSFGGPGGDRKRGPGDFGGGSGGEGGWRKRPRFEEPEVPPATLRVLVRNSDAGGIIGKVCPFN